MKKVTYLLILMFAVSATFTSCKKKIFDREHDLKGSWEIVSLNDETFGYDPCGDSDNNSLLTVISVNNDNSHTGHIDVCGIGEIEFNDFAITDAQLLLYDANGDLMLIFTLINKDENIMELDLSGVNSYNILTGRYVFKPMS